MVSNLKFDISFFIKFNLKTIFPRQSLQQGVPELQGQNARDIHILNCPRNRNGKNIVIVGFNFTLWIFILLRKRFPCNILPTVLTIKQ